MPRFDFVAADNADRLRRKLKKLIHTCRMCICMFCARTFGEYHHTVHDLDLTYARYHWCGRDWAIPTGPFEEGDQHD